MCFSAFGVEIGPLMGVVESTVIVLPHLHTGIAAPHMT